MPGAIKAILGARKLKAPTKKNTVHIYFYCIFLVFGNFQSALKNILYHIILHHPQLFYMNMKKDQSKNTNIGSWQWNKNHRKRNLFVYTDTFGFWIIWQLTNFMSNKSRIFSWTGQSNYERFSNSNTFRK